MYLNPDGRGRILPASEALTRLRKLGNPPSNTRVDLSNPSPKLLKALGILGSLTRLSSEIVLVKANWTSQISPWVKFFLEEVILGEPDGTLTPEGVELWESVVKGVAGCIGIVIDVDSIARDNSYLGPCVIQTWYKLLDEGREEWEMWCSVMTQLALHKDGKPVPEPLRVPTKHCSKMRRTEEEYGLIMARHINFQILEIPKMSKRDMWTLRNYICVLASHGHEPGDPNPLFRATVVEHAIPSLVKLISTAIFKRRTRSDTSASDLEDNVHPMVVLALRLLNSALQDPASVILALNSGVLKVLLKAYPCFFSFDDSPTRQPPEMRFSDWTLSVLKRISRLMVHPEPLRAFLSVSRKIGVDDPKGDLRVKSPALWNLWKSMKGKATLLRDIRRTIRETGMVVCGNEERCPLIFALYPQVQAMGMNPHERLQKRRLLCSRCKWVTYCSHSCQKAAWKQHRKVCGDMAGNRRAGMSVVPSHSDTIFFEALLVYFVGQHSNYIRGEVERYMSKLSTSKLSRDQQLIREGKKNPIIYVDFDTPSIPTPENVAEGVLGDVVSPWDGQEFDHGDCGVSNERKRHLAGAESVPCGTTWTTVRSGSGSELDHTERDLDEASE
ncbi:hypothetical protein AAF712_014770 [Marasmius tenuissimus]|uniref:MYND-type domain-containing protein n=1 Tax=Marasmius tenuissimus TaxID=585030 RepID=A0ABR2ZA49_9AGAR